MPPRNGHDRTLYLIDAMALAYRSYYVFISRPLINSKGFNTSASFGFTNSLLKLVEEHQMDHVAVVFEGEGVNFRNEIYPDYKANREEQPEEITGNLPFIRRIVEAFDIPVLEAPGVEADDVIGTLAARAAGEDAEVVIVSPDKDFKQLLGPRVSIFKPARQGESFDPITDASFREETGLDPLKFIDMLALMGDSSDNIPGVPGIGPKTAVKLLQKYESVENLIDHADELTGKRAREGMQNHAEDARMSKKLVRIRTDCDVGVDWHQLRRQKPHREKLEGLFRELEFNSLLRRVQDDGVFFSFDGQEGGKTAAQKIIDPLKAVDFGAFEETCAYDSEQAEYVIIRNRFELDQLAESLAQKDRFALDTETTSTDAMMASLVGASFSWERGKGFYVPSPLPDGTSEQEIITLLRPALTSDAEKIGHNIKYDMTVLAQHGVEVGGPIFDTMVAHYLLSPDAGHSLDDVALDCFNYRMKPIEDLIGKGLDQLTMRDVLIEEAGPYACEDADIAFCIADGLKRALEVVELDKIAYEMEFPLVRVLTDMERRGIRVDEDMLGELGAMLDKELEVLQRDILVLAGESFNINSTQQLGEILFEKLGLPVKTKTSTGKPSTKESVLKDLAVEHPMPGMILDYRELAKLQSTYVSALVALVHPVTGRIHTSFNQTVAATGRLSSSDPNLQNIPVRTETGREIRKAFVPKVGWMLMSADYVQIELRILAAMSGDENMKEAFARGEDIHTDAAARIYGIKPGAVTREQRRKAKEVNYGIPYGISPWGLSRRLRLPMGEAKKLIDTYNRSYPAVARYLNAQVETARRMGYAETLLGRRRYLPDLRSKNARSRGFAERAAVNMPIQGTQADMIKIAMVRLRERLLDEKFESRMLLQVHDELVLEAPEGELDAVRELVREEMAGALDLDVPIAVDIGVGGNWLAAH